MLISVKYWLISVKHRLIFSWRMAPSEANIFKVYIYIEREIHKLWKSISGWTLVIVCVMKKVQFFKHLLATFMFRILECYLWRKGSLENNEREHFEIYFLSVFLGFESRGNPTNWFDFWLQLYMQETTLAQKCSLLIICKLYICYFMSLAVDVFPVNMLVMCLFRQIFFHLWETKCSVFSSFITVQILKTYSFFKFKERFSTKNKQLFAAHDDTYLKRSITGVILLNDYFLWMCSVFLNTIFLCKLQQWAMLLQKNCSDMIPQAPEMPLLMIFDNFFCKNFLVACVIIFWLILLVKCL